MPSARSKNRVDSRLSHQGRGLEALARLLARVAAREFIAGARRSSKKKTHSKALLDD